MFVNPTSIRKLIQQSLRGSNTIVSSHAYHYLAVKLEEMGFDICKGALEILQSENEHRRVQGLNPLKKITDSHINKAIELYLNKELNRWGGKK
jgi:hypothetical protein